MLLTSDWIQSNVNIKIYCKIRWLITLFWTRGIDQGLTMWESSVVAVTLGKVTHQQCDPSWQSLYCVFLEKLTICFDFETYEKSPVLSYIGSRSFGLSTEEVMLQGSSRWGLTGSSQCITYHEGKVYFQGVIHLTISEWLVPENSAVSLKSSWYSHSQC